MSETDYLFIKLNTARNCLRYVVNAFKIKEIYIPYYLCPAVRIALAKENCKIIYYHIDLNFQPEELPKNAYILYPDYFGVSGAIVNELALKYKNLITDNAHSLFSRSKGIASFCSLRKFFPLLRDGAFLYTKKSINIELKQDNFMYNPHLLTYKELCENEKRLDNEDIKIISSSTFNAFMNYDFEKEKKHRLEKFNYFHSLYKETNRLRLNITGIQSPFGYPYLAESPEEADKLAKSYIDKGINIYRYWNNLPNSYEEKLFYTNLVVIPLSSI